MMRLAILAPIKTSFYSRLVAHLAAQEPGVELTDVIVRTPWTYRRIRGELRRDGARLLEKAYNKLVLAEKAYDGVDEQNIRQLAHSVGLPGRTLGDLAVADGFRLTVVKDQNDAKSQETLRAARPDVVAFTGGGLIRRALLDLPTIGVLNCHMGLLPRFRGMDVVEWPVAEYDLDNPPPEAGPPPELGLTLHLMDRGVDTGPILLKRRMEIRPDDTFGSIRIRIEPETVEMMMEAIRGLRDGTLQPQPQRIEQGRQYFRMHPRIEEYTRQKLRRYQAASPDDRKNDTNKKH